MNNINDIIKILEQTIDRKLKLKRDNQDWLIPDINTNIQGKEHGYLPLKPEPLYIAVLIWKPRKKQVRKGATTHTKNHGIESATQEGFTARFEIRNRSSFRLYDLIQSTP